VVADVEPVEVYAHLVARALAEASSP
jgi:hypothetical protein